MSLILVPGVEPVTEAIICVGPLPSTELLNQVEVDVKDPKIELGRCGDQCITCIISMSYLTPFDMISYCIKTDYFSDDFCFSRPMQFPRYLLFQSR